MTTEQITALITEYWAWMWAGIAWLIVFSLIIGVYDFMDKGRQPDPESEKELANTMNTIEGEPINPIKF